MAYRILSLDGGGVWALIQVRALIKAYGPDVTGHQVLKEFDLAAANSGGSIVLGGLVEDLPLSKLLSYFEDEALRRSIFQPTKRIVDRLVHDLLHVGPKWNAKAKLPALQHLLPQSGQLSLPEAAAKIPGAGNKPIHLLITSFDYDRNVAVYFRSAPTHGNWGVGSASDKVTLAEAIHASSNAPVNYFDEPATFNGQRFWDGAIAANNNPVLAGVTEAIALDVAPQSIIALSIGTGTVRLGGPPEDNPTSKLVTPRSPQDLKDDLAKVSGAITDDPPDNATYLSFVMTGGPLAPVGSRVVRLNPMVSPMGQPGAWTAPSGWTEAQFDFLANLHLDAIEPFEVAQISRFAEDWIAGKFRNQPIRMNIDTLKCELGWPDFAAGLAAWNQLRGLDPLALFGAGAASAPAPEPAE